MDKVKSGFCLVGILFSVWCFGIGIVDFVVRVILPNYWDLLAYLK